MEQVDLLKSVILPYLNFFFFLGLAIYFFRKPLNNMARAKHDKFVFAADEARKLMEETEKLHQNLEMKAATLAQEIEGIKAKSREAAEIEAKEIIENAKAIAEHLKKEARFIADAAVEQAKQELRREIVTLAKESVVKKIHEEMDSAGHKTFLKKQVKELDHLTHEVQA